MTKLQSHVAGMFRRGLPEGEQLDLLVAWIAVELTKDQDDASAHQILVAIEAAMRRATNSLSKLRER